MNYMAEYLVEKERAEQNDELGGWLEAQREAAAEQQHAADAPASREFHRGRKQMADRVAKKLEDDDE